MISRELVTCYYSFHSHGLKSKYLTCLEHSTTPVAAGSTGQLHRLDRHNLGIFIAAHLILSSLTYYISISPFFLLRRDHGRYLLEFTYLMLTIHIYFTYFRHVSGYVALLSFFRTRALGMELLISM
jgi:hypothetical protein